MFEPPNPEPAVIGLALLGILMIALEIANAVGIINLVR